MAIAKRGDDQYMLRMPSGMRDEIAAAAKTNGRSMNSEIIARLSGEGAGASLRDQFAMASLIGMMRTARPYNNDFEGNALGAFAQADAMLEVRSGADIDIAVMVEAELPGMNWHMARGKMTPDEPLFGAAILDGDEEIGAGEGDSPREAMRAAINAAVAELERRKGGEA